ncbi:molybdopterin-dependent oxidoreductase [Streptomyces sp. NPDC050485]|uniref:molybdopterin-dependent oxidoreductase n=1 Tax=Streptomyces sp. NPDC050485 TaxID=3365617 RepID=UPI003799E792
MAAAHPPPGPFRSGWWRSPLRGPWLTSVFALPLLAGITVLAGTGLLSYSAYNPQFTLNDQTPDHGILGFYLFTWPTDPYWLYRLNQGVHVTLGVALIPVLLAKLWSVLPKLFGWPPVRSPAHALERLSLLLLVGGGIFEFVTGVLNIQLYYVFPGSFYRLHFYGAWVFLAAFAVHVALKFPIMIAALRSRRMRTVLATDTAHTLPDDENGTAQGAGQSPTVPVATTSRRGAMALTGAASLTLLIVTAGQSIGGPWRSTAVLAPRGQDPGTGPNGFQINKTARAVGVTPDQIGPAWRLRLSGGPAPVILTRAQLLALEQRTAALPIACVEGWSTDDQQWSGVPLAALAALAGVPDASSALVESVQRAGSFRAAVLARNQVHHRLSLLALRVNGADLSPDHGFPARIILPAAPGVHNTKWVSSLTFRT